MGSPEEHSHSPQPDSQSPGVPRHPRPPPLEHRDLTGELSAERNRLSRTQAHLCLQLLNLERAVGSLYPYALPLPSAKATLERNQPRRSRTPQGKAGKPRRQTRSPPALPRSRHAPCALVCRGDAGRLEDCGGIGRKVQWQGGQRLPVAPALAAFAPWAASARGGGSRGQQLGGASQQLPTEGRTAAAPLTDKEARGAAPVPKVAVLGPGSPCPDPVLPRLSGGVTLTWHSGPS